MAFQKQKALLLTGCYGVPCGGVYLVLSNVLNKGEIAEENSLVTPVKFESEEVKNDEPKGTPAEPIQDVVPEPIPKVESAREQVINTVNTEYLTEDNRKKHGGQFYFNGSDYFRLPQLNEEAKWKEVLKQFQEGEHKGNDKVKTLVNDEAVKAYCLDEIKWTETTVKLDEFSKSTVPSPEYLCIWNYFRHSKPDNDQ
ncbi:hypothetical protein HF1_08440 [Mycoplasma haemofelis str. Langford 1]|uniref:Uncharacterized protein n=1 Tax=Mycoplasma haemofelis (strain Langford 1) TaxID=941640 RepID=E8ZI81_MYCHL|nr:hypothetical protein [Mycoplasma haemofelis]CBY92852.1 hypothetical protein HF1_08440 [Mycoplasma haemofelis str. Langford 1]